MSYDSDYYDYPSINWARISRALDFYQKYGYEYIEVPWFVPSNITDITLPYPPARPFGTSVINFPQLDLVGSAEQSIIWLHLLGKKLPEKIVACSPCFRDDKVDKEECRLKNFMKVELWWKTDVPHQHFAIMSQARHFLESQENVWNTSLEKTKDGIDLMLNGIEIGSYGWRQYKDLSWAYGTGLAEPRFSFALEK